MGTKDRAHPALAQRGDDFVRANTLRKSWHQKILLVFDSIPDCGFWVIIEIDGRELPPKSPLTSTFDRRPALCHHGNRAGAQPADRKIHRRDTESGVLRRLPPDFSHPAGVSVGPGPGQAATAIRLREARMQA